MAWLSISAGKQTRMRHLKEENITRDLTANFDLCLIISSAIFKKLMMWYMDYKKKNINYCKIFIYSNRRYSVLLRSLCMCNLEEPVWMVFHSPSFQPCLMHMPPSETIWSIAPWNPGIHYFRNVQELMGCYWLTVYLGTQYNCGYATVPLISCKSSTVVSSRKPQENKRGSKTYPSLVTRKMVLRISHYLCRNYITQTFFIIRM